LLTLPGCSGGACRRAAAGITASVGILGSALRGGTGTAVAAAGNASVRWPMMLCGSLAPPALGAGLAPQADAAQRLPGRGNVKK